MRSFFLGFGLAAVSFHFVSTTWKMSLILAQIAQLLLVITKEFSFETYTTLLHHAFLASYIACFVIYIQHAFCFLLK